MIDVTGRDEYVIAKALAYAITVIENLPKEMREASDAEDMRALLASMRPGSQAYVHALNGARAHVGLKALPTSSSNVVGFPG